MDNATYDGINLTPINTDEIYSRLGTTQIKTNPNSEFQRRAADIDQNAIRGVQQHSNITKFNTVMIITVVILLLLTLTSIALSVATFNRLAYQQFNMPSQIENTNNDTLTRQIDKIQGNISHNALELVETQLITAQNKISQNLNQLDAKLENFISLQTQYASVQTQTQCGQGLWYRLIFLNMSDPTEQCPFAWKEYNTNGVRACGRPTNLLGSCAAIRHFTSRRYSRVCGRVIGYQFASPDAFRHHMNSNSIDLDGINITHGTNHSHIWSYVAGYTSKHVSNCPCSNYPSSVGDNYYCESGNPNNPHTATLYTDDPLWDGQQCEGTCCTGTNSPPWFSVQLPAPTTDAIEVSICCDQSTNDEDVPVALMEIYVQ